MSTPILKPTIKVRIRWYLRHVIPFSLTDDQDALLRAVLLHADLTGYRATTLLPGIADQHNASPQDRALIAHILR